MIFYDKSRLEQCLKEFADQHMIVTYDEAGKECFRANARPEDLKKITK